MVIASDLLFDQTNTKTRKSTNDGMDVFGKNLTLNKGESWIVGSIKSPIHSSGSYVAFYEQDADDGGVTVSIPSLPGCITEADTFEDGYQYLQDALAGWIEVARAKGLDVPPPDME